MDDQQNTEPKTTDADGALNVGDSLPQESKKKNSSWLGKFSVIVGICNLCIGIPFGVWYIDQIVNQSAQVAAGKLELEGYSLSLQSDFMNSVPDLSAKAERQSRELKRLGLEVKRLNDSYESSTAMPASPDGSLFVWHMRDLILGIHKYPLDSVQKKGSMALLSQLRASADSVKFGKHGEEVIKSLGQDLVSLREAKTLDVNRIDQGLLQLLELTDLLQLTDRERPSPDVLRGDSHVAANDWVVLRNIWKEIKSVIQVRRLNGPDADFDERYFVLEKFRLKVLEMEYLFDANDMIRLSQQLGWIKRYVQTHFDPNDPETPAVLGLINELNSLVDIPGPSFTSTLSAIENYFNAMQADKDGAQ